jgi:hypothetical protein
LGHTTAGYNFQANKVVCPVFTVGGDYSASAVHAPSCAGTDGSGHFSVDTTYLPGLWALKPE